MVQVDRRDGFPAILSFARKKFVYETRRRRRRRGRAEQVVEDEREIRASRPLIWIGKERKGETETGEKVTRQSSRGDRKRNERKRKGGRGGRRMEER